MATMNVSLSGFKQLERKLNELPKRIRRKVLSQSLRAGAKIIQAEAKARVPKDTGELRRSIKVRVGKVKNRGDVKIIVITGAGDFKGDQYYGAFVEYGYRRGKRSAGVASLQKAKSSTKDSGKKAAIQAKLDKADDRQMVPARPFMRPAFDTKKNEAQRAITVRMVEGIVKEAKQA